jgi:dihydrofolate synthase / folylpolyglutamate synthase
MADHARSDSPAVQAQLDRFAQLSPGRDILGLERITALLAELGNPHLHLPPVFHVAGTNGKGSTCAFLRAAVESAGLTAHVYSSPHLVRFNERFRVAGRLITDEELAPILSEVLDKAEAAQIGPSFFEATTAAMFIAFARTPADVAIIEVGLGGRLDATNVIESPAVCGIAQLGVDHQAFLGDDAVTIAGEKAGIAKVGVPLVTMAYEAASARRIAEVATQAGALWHPKGSDWDSVIYNNHLHYRDQAGKLSTPLPRLAGAYQAENAALAIAMLRHQKAVTTPDAAIKAAIGWATWPARMQKLGDGPLTKRLPAGSAFWIDGCHNPAGAIPVAAHVTQLVEGASAFHIICGILANKDADGILRAFLPLKPVLHPIAVPGHESHSPESLADWAKANGLEAHPATSLEAAIADCSGTVLVMGSLYLASEALRLNDEVPV